MPFSLKIGSHTDVGSSLSASALVPLLVSVVSSGDCSRAISLSNARRETNLSVMLAALPHGCVPFPLPGISSVHVVARWCENLLRLPARVSVVDPVCGALLLVARWNLCNLESLPLCSSVVGRLPIFVEPFPGSSLVWSRRPVRSSEFGHLSIRLFVTVAARALKHLLPSRSSVMGRFTASRVVHVLCVHRLPSSLSASVLVPLLIVRELLLSVMRREQFTCSGQLLDALRCDVCPVPSAMFSV